MKVVVDVVLGVALGGAWCAQMARWLRVLQREHYDPSSLLRFLGRWSSPPRASAAHGGVSSRRPITLSHVLIVAIVAAVVFAQWDLAVAFTALYGLLCPVGLALRGRTSELEWTRRLRTVALGATVASALIALVGLLAPHPFLGGVVAVLAVNPILNAVTRALAPFENRRAQAFVDQAVGRLRAVSPRVVAVTGSYGKTSTKNYLSALLGTSMGVVASPRSFNNRAGLSRAINENLAEGTRIFIAEMGTYGPGEIRELTSWCVPEIAVVTAIGPVHLERMGTLDVIERAKHEITERAATVVLNVDDPRLAGWAAGLRAEGKRVVTAGSRTVDADVRVAASGGRWSVSVRGEVIGDREEIMGVQPTNLACALAVALEVGVDAASLLARLATSSRWPIVSTSLTSPAGVLVVDDTFNANPASARAALSTLRAHSRSPGGGSWSRRDSWSWGPSSTWRTCDWPNWWGRCRLSWWWWDGPTWSR